MKIRKLSIIILAFVLIGCSSVSDDSYELKYNNEKLSFGMNESLGEYLYDRPLVEHEINNVTLTAVGDMMFHKWQLHRGYDSTTDSFDFTHSFKYISKYLENSDCVIGNLETTLAGKNKGLYLRPENAYKGYLGFPCFNTPEILAYNLKEAGFDLISTVNNHSLDSKAEGVISTIKHLEDQGLYHVGTYRNKDEAEEILTIDINNIEFAFVAYTYGTNGLTVPDSMPYLVNTLEMYDDDEIKKMLSDVEAADDTGVDYVVVIMHFGEEYFNYPNEIQKDIVNDLFDAGADIIIGSHPHVLQPLEIRDIECSDGTTKKGIVMYSLGNFISSQRYTKQYPQQTDVSTIMNINFEKIDNHKPIIKSISFVPTCTYRSSKEISVLPVDEVLENLNHYNLDINEYGINRLKYTQKNAIKHILAYTHNDYIFSNYEYTISLE